MHIPEILIKQPSQISQLVFVVVFFTKRIWVYVKLIKIKSKPGKLSLFTLLIILILFWQRNKSSYIWGLSKAQWEHWQDCEVIWSHSLALMNRYGLAGCGHLDRQPERDECSFRPQKLQQLRSPSACLLQLCCSWFHKKSSWDVTDHLNAEGMRDVCSQQNFPRIILARGKKSMFDIKTL